MRRRQPKIDLPDQVTHSTVDSILDNTPAVVFVKDLDGRYRMINRKFIEIMGLAEADVIGKTDLDLFGPIAGRVFKAHDDEVLQTGKALQWDETVHLPQGVREFLSTRFPIRDHAGRIESICVISTDITERNLAIAELARSEQRFRDFAETAADWFWELDATLRFTYVSEKARDVLGIPTEQVIGKTREELHGENSPVDTPAWRAHLRLVRQRRKFNDFEIAWPMPDGEIRQLSISGIPLFDEQGDFTGYRGVGRDITRHVRIEDNLRQREASVRVLTDMSPVGILKTDPAGNSVYANARCAELIGRSTNDCLAAGWIEAMHPNDRDLFQREWKLSLQGDSDFREEIRFIHGDDKACWVTANTTAEKDERGNLLGFIVTLTDITELKRSQEDLQHLAHYDALTHLPNRLLLEARLEHAIQRCKRNASQLALIFLDLDRFKFINDSMGHAAGDQLLQQVACRLLDCVRQDDTVARLGGDEFILLIEDVDSVENATFVAEKIINALLEPVTLRNQDVHISTSMGICLFPQDGQTPDNLLRNADAAMYSAKQAGRNGYHFYTRDLTIVVQQRMQLETELRHAIEHGELRLMFQPQWSMYDDGLSGAEVLLRWQHPQRGLLAPKEFIDTAEESDLILRLGEWVRRAACRQASEWLDSGLPLKKISINVASAEIERPGFTNDLHRLLLNTGLPADMLELEVTENLIMKETQLTIAELRKLRALGVSLAIDDFGTGYSSLSYLKRLPISSLKIDRSFVRDIPSDPNDMAITRAIIALAHSLGMVVVAEGVETREQRNFLRAEGCEQAQGFFYAKPLTIAEFEDLLQSTL